MEHSLISRRVSWNCTGTVEVAPGWVLGRPPPYLTHFISERYVNRYLRATCNTDITPSTTAGHYVRMPYTRKDHTVTVIAIWWIWLFSPAFVAWDNFEYAQTVYPKWRYDNRPSIDSLLFYRRTYNDFVHKLLCKL